MKTLSLAVLCLSFASCGRIPEVIEPGNWDLTPPIYQSHRMTSPKVVQVLFDEPVFARLSDFCHEAGINRVEVQDNSCLIYLEEEAPLGCESILEGVVSDERGNSLLFHLVLAGYNPDVPSLVINEFTTRGSSSHPDKVELKVLEDGNLAGISLFLGSPVDFTDRYVFPSVAVSAGDFVVLHCRPPVEVPPLEDENENPAASDARDSCPTAWDLFWTGGPGLSGNNGALTLCSSLTGPVLDAVVYSNRNLESDEDYGGWGSRTLHEQVQWLVEHNQWRGRDLSPAPEDAARSDNSTATRSLCRDSESTDHDLGTDWHVVPTSAFTFGTVNSEDAYLP